MASELTKADIDKLAVDRLPIIYLQSGTTHVLHPVGTTYDYWTVWYDGRSVVIAPGERKAWKADGYTVSRKHAVHVVDHGDHHLKILVYGQMVQKCFQGVDDFTTGYWRLSAHGSGLSKSYAATYVGDCSQDRDKADHQIYVDGRQDLSVVFAPSE